MSLPTALRSIARRVLPVAAGLLGVAVAGPLACGAASAVEAGPRLAVEAARSISSDIPIVASMTFDPTPRGFFTVMGTDIATAALELTAAGANVVGSNCGRGSDDMVEVAREFRRHTDGPLIIQPNAGLPELEDGRAVYRETPTYMAERAKVLMEFGVGIIGGCCGTTPEHVAALREVVDGR